MTVNTLSLSQLMYRCDKQRTAALPQLRLHECLQRTQPEGQSRACLHSGGREAQSWIVTVS